MADRDPLKADNLQARKINLKDSGLQLVGTEEIVVVLWRDLLEALSGLREHELVAGAEAALLDDFLTYVEDHFPDLGPFRSLALCDGVPTRIGRRLRQVLGEAAGSEAEKQPPRATGRDAGRHYCRTRRLPDHRRR